MFDNKVTRDTLCFNERNNLGYGHYVIDWETGLKYVRPDSDLIVNEGGMVFLTSDMFRNPSQRDSLRRMFGIEVCSVAELPPLYVPQSDRKITKRSLMGTSYLVDRRTKRVLNIDKRQYIAGFSAVARWTAVGCPAASYNVLATKERNVAAEKTWKVAHAGLLLQARGVKALQDTVRRESSVERMVSAVKNFLNAPSAMPVNTEICMVWLAHLEEHHSNAYAELLVDLTADYREYPYLTIAPNEL